MKKIIHLSDLHVGYEHCDEALARIIDSILSNYEPGSHVLVVTGDIVDDANTEGSYEQARSQLRRLEDQGFKVLVVPGNHDYGSGGKAKEKFVRLFKRAFFDNENVTYPKLDIDGDIAFIGLDSMADTFGWIERWGADGELGKEQLNGLAEMLASEALMGKKKVVYLHHHPFDVRGPFHMLEDYRKFKKVIEGKVDCLLFGHNHNGNQYPDTWGIPQCFDGSSSTGKSREKGKSATPLRVIELD